MVITLRLEAHCARDCSIYLSGLKQLRLSDVRYQTSSLTNAREVEIAAIRGLSLGRLSDSLYREFRGISFDRGSLPSPSRLVPWLYAKESRQAPWVVVFARSHSNTVIHILPLSETLRVACKGAYPAPLARTTPQVEPQINITDCMRPRVGDTRLVIMRIEYGTRVIFGSQIN